MYINLVYNYNDYTTTYAAQELASYLNVIEGLQLQFLHNDIGEHYSITFQIDPSILATNGKYNNPILDDAFSIAIEKQGGKIIASNSRSILLAVYRYLYLIGYRFPYPNKSFDFIPTLDSVENLYLDHLDFPSRRHRGVCIEGANSIENILDYINWMPKIGFNCFFVQFRIPYTFLQRWYSHEFNPYQESHVHSYEEILEYSKQIDEAMELRSLIHHRVGHGWTCEAIGYPSLGWMTSDDLVEDDVKQYLAEVNGTRGFHHGIPMNTNLCYSNEDVINKFTTEVLHYANENPNIDYLHIWIADAYNNICECNSCSNASPTDQYIHILNQIDRALTQEGLPTRLVFLLYQELLWAPNKGKLENPERFTLMFAPITRTFEKSYPEDFTYSQTPDYIKNKITLPTTIEENIAFLRDWQSSFKGDSFVYDYPLGRAHYGDLGYTHISKIINADIRSLDYLQVDGYISCQELRVGLPNYLPNYMMGHTLFNSSLTYEEVRDDYFKHAYGNDYQLVIDYLETLSSFSSPDYFNGKGPRINPHRAEQYRQLYLVALEFKKTITCVLEYLKENVNNIENVETYLFSWNSLDYHTEYSLRLGMALNSLSSGDFDATERYWKEFHEYICVMENEHQSSLDVYRVYEVATNYAGFPKII